MTTKESPTKLEVCLMRFVRVVMANESPEKWVEKVGNYIVNPTRYQ